MNSTKIITFDYLRQFNRIHVKITSHLFGKIKNKILEYEDCASIAKKNKVPLKIIYNKAIFSTDMETQS